MLKKNMNIKIVALLFIVIILLGFLLQGGYQYLTEEDSSEYDITSSEYITVYIEDSTTGDYYVSTTGEFPTQGYELDTELSYCSNGTDLIWDDATGNVKFSFVGSEQCYLYYKEYEMTLYRQILLNNGVSTSSDPAEAVKETIKYIVDEEDKRSNPVFTSITTTADVTDDGMYATEDDYGTSYYFRGDIDNNYVSYAGFTWRIVRIDGKSDVKLVLDLSTLTTEQVTALAKAFTLETDGVVNMQYTGYTYITSDESNVETVNSSNIKTVVDDWYDANLSSYSSYIVDGVFCGDRSGYYSLNSDNKTFSTYDFDDYGKDGATLTIFTGAYKRLYLGSPTLVCSSEEDSYTVTSSAVGNNELTNSIAMLSADEVVFAGLALDSSDQSSSYLNFGTSYWTMTPRDTAYKADILSYYTRMFGVWTGKLRYLYTKDSSGSVYLPSISIYLDGSIVSYSGEGTLSTPYVITTS